MDTRYINKENAYEQYFKNVRRELLDLIPTNLLNGSLLEIGAGSCNTLVYAKENGYASKVFGVELCKIDNSNQDNSILDGLIIGDIEKLEFPYKEKEFDVIICGDVLEHLIEPYLIVNKLRIYLKDDGVLIVSLPNFRKFSVLKSIFFDGDFKYTEAGILDKTHLRFFCKKNMIDLLENQNFKVIQVVSNEQCNLKRYFKSFRINKLIGCFFKYIFEEFVTLQYYLKAIKK